MEYPTKKTTLYTIITLLLIGIGLILAVTLGAAKISLRTIWDSLFNYQPILEMQLVRDVRLPRALATVFVGGILGVSGAMMQGVTRNPIAEPSLLGISQGATLSIAILLSFQSVAGLMSSFIASFIGALFVGLLIIAFTLHRPANLSMSKLLLAGTALSTFFVSLASIIALLSNQSQMLGFWLVGGFRGVTWSGTILVMITGIVGLLVALLLAGQINVVSLGEDVATGLGINASAVRIKTLLLVIVISASAVAVGKNIAFVGLIIPQIASRLIGKDYRKIIPLSFLLGSVLLVFSDIAARLLLQPFETPIGIFTSLLGVPIFIMTLRKEWE